MCIEERSPHETNRAPNRSARIESRSDNVILQSYPIRSLIFGAGVLEIKKKTEYDL